MRPEIFSMDAFAPSSVIVSTNANPRGRPVSRSRATRTLRTSIPNGAYECKDANVSPLRAGESAYP